MMKCLIFWLAISSMDIYGESANILAILPYPFYSHYASFIPIFKAMAARGHNVTVVSNFPQKSPVPNLTDIVVPNVQEEILEAAPKSLLDMGTLKFQLTGVHKFGYASARAVLKTPQLKRLIADKDSKFDLVVTETFCIHEPFVAFGHKFNAPVLNLLSLFFFPRGAYLSGNPWPLSYVPVTMYFGFSDRMSFIERVQNTFYYYWDVITSHLIYMKEMDAIMREHFVYPGSENLPPLEDLLRKTSLTLLEHDLVVGYPVPLQKNVVTFAAVNTKPADKLPADLQKYMDNNKDGVIYLSMGSYFSVATLEPHMQEALISALKKLKYKIIMKLSDEDLINQLKGYNHIEIRSWLPQRSILAHPNCKLFITHCGSHGLTEGIYHAVPMVGLPLLGDQRYNAKIIETSGAGVALDLFTLTQQKILSTIDEVLTNPKYRENVKKRSAILRDTPMDTMDNAIYWIEYVIRHKGAPHLRPAVLDLHWYQYLMLDVIAFYLLLLIGVVYIVKFICTLLIRFICCVLCRKKSVKNKKD